MPGQATDERSRPPEPLFHFLRNRCSTSSGFRVPLPPEYPSQHTVGEARRNRGFFLGSGNPDRSSGGQIYWDQGVRIGRQAQFRARVRELDDQRATVEGCYAADPQFGIEAMCEVVTCGPGASRGRHSLGFQRPAACRRSPPGLEVLQRSAVPRRSRSKPHRNHPLLVSRSPRLIWNAWSEPSSGNLRSSRAAAGPATIIEFPDTVPPRFSVRL